MNSGGIIERYKEISGGEHLPEDAAQRILRIGEVLNIRDNDAIWSIFIVLDMYLRSVDDFNASIRTTFKDALLDYKERGGEINLIEKDEDKKFSYANMMCAFGMVLLFGVVCFAAGLRLNQFSPEWLTGTRYDSPLAFLMQIPSGWLFFVCASIPAGWIFKKTIQKIRHGGGTRQEKISKHGLVAMMSAMVCLIGALTVILILI